jgi:hypothetical protein
MVYLGNLVRYQIELKEYADAGADQFFLAFQDPFNSSALELFMDAIK